MQDEKKSEDNNHEAPSSPPTTAPSKVEPNFTAPHGPNVRVSKHPVLAQKVSVLRSSSTSPHNFRAVLREITFHLGYEATSSLTTRDVPITVPSSSDARNHIDATGSKIRERVALIPILRSGLGMVDPMLELVNGATVHHVGMYKNRSNHMPVVYYNRLPRRCDVDVAYVLDPLIATSNTVTSVVGMLKKVRRACVHACVRACVVVAELSLGGIHGRCFFLRKMGGDAYYFSLSASLFSLSLHPRRRRPTTGGPRTIYVSSHAHTSSFLSLSLSHTHTIPLPRAHVSVPHNISA
jgi:uracil phosphoribosyltransferase